MPTISKKTKVKKVVAKKKTTPTKVKAAPVKKKVVKKTVVKKTKKPAPKQANKIVVDIISDDENTNNQFIDYKTEAKVEEEKDIAPVFSSWSDFNKKTEPEDILRETDEADEEDAEPEPQDVEEYDKQKKFFSDWAVSNTPKEGEEKPNLAPKKSIGLYRRQAIFYLGATLILLVAVAYFFFVKLNIQITPQGETINDSVSFSIVSTDASSTPESTDSIESANKSISGDLKIEDATATKTFQTTGEDVTSAESTGLVTGTVTLVNKYNKNQALVATTRLLSPDGKLFRLKEAVNIPAGGTATANVYADKTGADMEISAPTRFTIPGLWAGIQDRIYAESSDPLVYGSQVKRVVKQSDLDNAKKDIAEVIDLKIKNELQSVGDDMVSIYGNTSDDNLITEFDVKVGDEKNEFTIKATKKIVIATFSKDKVIGLAKARLALIVSDDKQLSNFNTNQITYTIDSFDQDTKTAEVKAYFSGLMSLKSDSSLIDRKKLVGLNESQISQYLNTFPEVKDYKLEFWPSFIKTAPNLPDRINIKIGD